MKKFFTFLIFLLCFLDVGMTYLVSAQAAALPYTQDFQSSNDFTFVNGTQVNKWAYGTVTGNPAGSIYVSNDNGTSNAYNNGSSSVTQAYRDITIPAGTTTASLSFDWKSNGNDTDYDYLRVWLVPATFTPTAGTQITAAAGSRIQVGGNYQNQTTWQTYSNPAINLSAYAGSTLRLVFEWRNDGIIGSNPPAAVDNINLFIPTCLIPVNLAVPTVQPNGATIAWTAPTPAPVNGYEYIVTTTNTPPTNATAGTATTALSVPLSSLTAGTTYYWWVRSVCAGTDRSTWVAGPSFTPGQIGSGTGSSGNLPIYSCFGFNYSQQIYTAAEVAGAIGTNNYITKIRFFVSATASTQANYNQWVVYMGNTTQANYATTTSWVPTSAMQQVYTGTLPTMTNGTWVELNLTNPFVWNGTSNIVIAVDENASGYSCTQNWGNYAAGSNRGILHYSDSVNADPSAPPTATSRYSDIPRVQLVAVALQPCTTAPPSNITMGQLTPTSASVSWTPAIGATYVVRYRVAPSGAWQSVTLTAPLSSNYTMTGLLELTNYEVQIATICGGTQGAFSASTLFTTPAVTYCTAGPTSTTVYEYLSNVTVTPTGFAAMVSNSATPPPFYSDYTADQTRQITLIRGTANNAISATKVWPNSQYSAGTRAWIDFNRNGIFGDVANELVLDSPSNTTAVVNNLNFTVPTVAQGAYAGTLPVRMRVILQEGGVPSPCGGFTWGEVEDYSVKLIDLQPCTTAAPTPVTVTNMTATTAYVSWMPAAGAVYTVRWRQGTTGAWLPSAAGQVLPAGQSWYTITNLTEQTAYQVQVMTTCNGTAGAWGASVSFTTPPLTYCPMTGSGTNDHISNVTVTPTGYPIMNNTSVQNNYTLYNTPATLINLEMGSTNNQISVGKGWTGSSSSDAVTAWIDWNRDGIFTDAERILISAASTTTPVTATFNVPTAAQGAYTGNLNTTMRVVLRRSSAPVMCTDPANGEVEDYYVKLRPCSNIAPTPPTFTTITHTSAIVNWTASTNNQNYIVQYRPVTTPASPWVSVNASALNGNPPLTITGLTPATTYQVQISAVCNGTAGTPGAIRTFITRCDPTPPNVTISNVTSGSATVTWNPIVPSATYIMRYREVGTGTWINVTLPAPPTNTFVISGLSSYVTYEVQIANICVGETTPNPWSNPQVFTTVRVCEIPPPGLTITQLAPTTAEVTWDAYTGTGATGTYILRYRKVGIPSWTTVTVNTNTYLITGLLELTKYEMQVANVCTGTPGNFTPLYYFTTPTVTYCQMSSGSATTEYINKVTVTPYQSAAFVNESTGAPYTYYTANPDGKQIVLVQGSQGNVLKIDKTGTGATGVAAWIDFNRNGYFDVNEKILSNGPNTTDAVSAAFTVPADAFVSLTDYKYVVMRVAMQKDGVPVNCTNFANGEVEDYLVRIIMQPVVNPLNQTDIMIYPNPVTTVLNVKNISKKANYKIYSSAGQLISSGLILNNKIDVSRLINGLYVIELVDGDKIVQKKFIKE